MWIFLKWSNECGLLKLMDSGHVLQRSLDISCFQILGFRRWTKVWDNCFICWVIAISWAILISMLWWETRNQTKEIQMWPAEQAKIEENWGLWWLFAETTVIVLLRNDSEHCWQLTGWWCLHPCSLLFSLLHLWSFWIPQIAGQRTKMVSEESNKKLCHFDHVFEPSTPSLIGHHSNNKWTSPTF